MSTRVVERVDDWDQETFSGGYRALQKRAEESFSGVFRAEGAELYMTRGTVVGIRRGDIEDFEAASGTVFTAPTDALPLLAVMQERSDEVRAKYYTEDTGIREVDGTLEDGGFTGYVELSENVLSGDYYLVYHQGNSMSVGFVGNTERLITGDEAFETTDGEVGIYEVRPVDIEPIEIPEPAEPEPDQGETGGAAGAVDTDSREPSDAEVTGQTPTDDAGSAGSDGAPAADSPETVENADGDQSPATDHPAAPAGGDGTAAESSPEPDQSGGQAGGAKASGTAGGNERSGSVTDGTETSALDASRETTTPDTSRETPPSDSTRETTQSPEPERETTASERRRASESLTERGESETADDDGERRDPLGSEAAGTESVEDRSTGNQHKETGTTAVTEPDTRTDRGQASTARSEGRPAQDQSTGTAQPQGTASSGDQQPVDSQRGPTTDDPGQLETRSIPSLDPERTISPSHSGEQSRRDTPGRADASSGATAESANQQAEPQNQSDPAETTQSDTAEAESTGAAAESTGTQEAETTSSAETATESTEAGTGQSTGPPPSEVAERIEELEELLEERETELNRLESDLYATESERDSLRRELDQVREERDQLQEEVEKLESELRRLEEDLGAATDAQQRMTPQEALTGTDLFVRYDSKGDATLAKARDSGLRQQDVAGNLQLEKHTQFEADVVAVGGREYDEFLEDTVAYKFAHWVVYDLLFEIQSTGHTESLADLYKALPKINRIELNGTVNATYVEEGEEVQSTESFDVVFRERMGDPLLVANINESRQGATEGMMEQLITAAERVGQTSDQFASAFLVTESFFEPEALETVEQATRGGILSRDKRKSFVNLSRKHGYHLCLVEARNENFHLEVPEL